MAGFTDLIANALPYLARERIEATQGTSWEWYYRILDNDDAAVDMTSGYTGTLSIRQAAATADLVTVNVAFPSPGLVRCKASPAVTAAATPGQYFHELTITRTSDSASIKCVGAGDSRFVVKKAVS